MAAHSFNRMGGATLRGIQNPNCMREEEIPVNSERGLWNFIPDFSPCRFICGHFGGVPPFILDCPLLVPSNPSRRSEDDPRQREEEMDDLASRYERSSITAEQIASLHAFRVVIKCLTFRFLFTIYRFTMRFWASASGTGSTTLALQIAEGRTVESCSMLIAYGVESRGCSAVASSF